MWGNRPIGQGQHGHYASFSYRSSEAYLVQVEEHAGDVQDPGRIALDVRVVLHRPCGLAVEVLLPLAHCCVLLREYRSISGKCTVFTGMWRFSNQRHRPVHTLVRSGWGQASCWGGARRDWTSNLPAASQTLLSHPSLISGRQNVNRKQASGLFSLQSSRADYWNTWLNEEWQTSWRWIK